MSATRKNYHCASPGTDANHPHHPAGCAYSGENQNSPMASHERRCEFIRPTQIRNTTTGAWMPVDLEIHRDDIDWLMDMLNAAWLLDWQLDMAEREAAGKPPPFRQTAPTLRTDVRAAPSVAKG